MKKTISLLLAVLLCISMLIPVSAQQNTSPFTDLPTTHWAFDSAQYAFNAGVISGTYYNEATGERHFTPKGTVSITQFLAVVTRACYPEEVAYEVENAAGQGPWYAPNVKVAENHKLLKDCGENIISGNASRYQMAVIICNLMQDKGRELPTPAELSVLQNRIGDWNKIPEELKTPVATVFQFGIIQGVDQAGTFAGDATITRDQLVVIYCRLMNAIYPGSVVFPEHEQEPQEPAVKPGNHDEPEGSAEGTTYILNTNTMKFHYPSCASAKRIASYNRMEFTGDRAELIAKGYTPCKVCHP